MCPPLFLSPLSLARVISELSFQRVITIPSASAQGQNQADQGQNQVDQEPREVDQEPREVDHSKPRLEITFRTINSRKQNQVDQEPREGRSIQNMR